MDCSICACPFNKVSRSPVQCFSCQHTACKECVRTFLCSASHLPKCMNCNVSYPTNFLVRKLNRTWVINTYKPKLTEVLTSIELGKLPDTQPYVEAEVEKQRLMKQNEQYNAELRILKQKMRKISTAIYANQHLLRGDPVPAHLMNEYVDGKPIVVDSKKQFVMPCPLDCRGFLSIKYKCGTCQKSVCPDCFVLKEEGHECLESNRLTAEMIKRESKGCPKCGARICKIDGCDQMYCTAQRDGVHCNTAFSWKTGKIETGTIHNPHYYELMNKKGVQIRNAGDVQCGGVPNIRGVILTLDAFSKLQNYKEPEVSSLRLSLLQSHRRISEIVQYTANEFRRKIQDHDAHLRSIRVRYMMKSISKTTFSDLIYKSEREYQKNIDLHHILELISISGIETFIGIVQDFPRIREFEIGDYTDVMKTIVDNIKEKLAQLHGIREYCNEQLKELSITYNCVVHPMNEEFLQTPVKHAIRLKK
jgi:hypothetical protein